MAPAPPALVTPAAEVDAARLLAPWGCLLAKPFRLLGVSVFGDLFLEDAGGSIKMLDLVAGELKEIASCREEFEWGLSDPGHQQDWLMANLAGAAARRDLRPVRGQCLAFRKPPLLGGNLAPDNLVVWDLYNYHEGLAKLYHQIFGLSEGTEITTEPA